MSKFEAEFFPTSAVPWTRVPGPVEGLSECILARDSHSGIASRMLRFAPGTDTSPNGVLTHEFWEEVYILEGSIHDLILTLGRKVDGKLKERKNDTTFLLLRCYEPYQKHKFKRVQSRASEMMTY